MKPDREARAAWRAEVARALGGDGGGALASLALAVGLVVLAAVAWRVARVSPAPWAVGLAWAVVTSAVVAAAYAWVARARRRIARALARPGRLACPRCDASVTAGACGECGTRVVVARGLVIAFSTDAWLRDERWRSAARGRLRRIPRGRGAPSSLALGAAALGIVGFVAAARWLGAPVSSTVEASTTLGAHESPTGDGVARANGGAAGPATRPFAPLELGTQVFAHRPGDAYLYLAAVVEVADGRARAVYADGESAWVGARGLRSPEIAHGDAVEIERDGRWRAATVEGRRGPAVLVDGAWTSASRLRVRVDAVHERGEGRAGHVAEDAWVEGRTEDGAWRPGVRVGVDGPTIQVVLADGQAPWLEWARVRSQGIGPGARVWLANERAPRIVAARVGHAIAVVDDAGARRWTAVSRVRR